MAEEKTLYKKLAAIMAEVGYIPKNGTNTHFGYKYATESDVQDAVRDKLSARNIMMIPHIQDTQLRETTTRKGSTEYIYKVRINYQIIDADSGEQIQFAMEGEGQDAGDKGIYKAISGAQKYAIMKLFMIPTGDDPEATPPDRSADSSKGNSKGSSSKGSSGGGSKQTPEQKKAADKQFFDERDRLNKRIKELAVVRETNPVKVTDYLIGKANEIQGKTYKSINSINLETIEKVLEKLEAATPQTNGQQETLLDEVTGLPRK